MRKGWGPIVGDESVGVADRWRCWVLEQMIEGEVRKQKAMPSEEETGWMVVGDVEVVVGKQQELAEPE